MTLHFVLVVFALIALFLAALGIPTPKVNLTATGLFLWLLSEVVK